MVNPVPWLKRLSPMLFVLVSGLFALAAAELAGRLFLMPNPHGDDELFGVRLPPYRIVSSEQARATDREAWYGDLVVDGRKITVGDIAGYHRFDAALGYTHLESTTSTNGWWHANNIGAREIAPTSAATPPGLERWLLLGESFAHGSGLPTEQGWAHVADMSAAPVDIVNLAVDGYGMAQAYLRYTSLASELEHQGVLMMFVPDVDLWREVNTLRTLGEPWKVQTVMPRFVLEELSLSLVPGPYAQPGGFFADNAHGLSPTLREHLRRYDRFYFPLEHERPPVLGQVLAFRLAVAAYGRYARGTIRRKLWEPGSEALQVFRAIVTELQRDTAARGREFVLLVLPTANDLRLFRESRGHEARWSRLIDAVCAGNWRCVDLSPMLRSVREKELDTGLDGNHYGPRVNARIADAVLAAIPN